MTRSPKPTHSAPTHSASANEAIYIAEEQMQHIHELIDSALLAVPKVGEMRVNLKALKIELDRARIVPARDIPPNVVRIGSWVEVENVQDESVERFQLAYPEHSDLSMNRISILSPLGIAVIGQRLGDLVKYQAPGGITRMHIRKVSEEPLD